MDVSGAVSLLLTPGRGRQSLDRTHARIPRCLKPVAFHSQMLVKFLLARVSLTGAFCPAPLKGLS